MAATWVQDWAWAFTTGAWALWVLAAILLWVALFKDRSRGRRRCPRCWYDMTGVPGLKCPECGREARREKRLFSTRRRWRLAAFGVALALVGITSHRAPTALRHGVWAAVPIPVLNFVLGFWEEEARRTYDLEFSRYKQTDTRYATPAWTQWERLLVASVIESTPISYRYSPFMEMDLEEWFQSHLCQGLGLEMRPAIPVFGRDLRGKEPVRAESAAFLLATCAAAGSGEAVELLLDAGFGAHLESVRAAATSALSDISPLNPEARHALLKIITSSQDHRSISIAAYALVSTMTDSRADQKLFDQLISHPVEPVRVNAMKACDGNARSWMIDPICQAVVAKPSISALEELTTTSMFLGPADPRWMEALRSAAQAESRTVRAIAADQMVVLAKRTPANAQMLIEELSVSKDPMVRERLVQAVPEVAVAPSVAGQLLRKLLREDDSPLVRALAAIAARSTDSDNPEWLPALRAALADEGQTVRSNAAASMVVLALRSDGGHAIVESVLASCADDNARCILLIGLVNDFPAHSDRADRLWRAIEEENAPKVHAMAMRALAVYPHEIKRLVSQATRSLKSEAYEQQLAALNVLGRLGPLAASALDRIRELESSPDPRIAAAARDAREKIEGR